MHVKSLAVAFCVWGGDVTPYNVIDCSVFLFNVVILLMKTRNSGSHWRV